MLLKLFHKVQKGRILPNTFSQPSITLISKPDKDASKSEVPRVSSVILATQE
jgi:hypothetical protein